MDDLLTLRRGGATTKWQRQANREPAGANLVRLNLDEAKALITSG